MTHFIGISGKPGSVKVRYRFKIMQELRYHGYRTQSCSLAQALYQEMNQLIETLHAGATFDALAQQYRLPENSALDLFSMLDKDALGDKHPQYGYSRRNPNMRRALSTYALLVRHHRGEDYWIEQMAQATSPDVDFAIFVDLRFPNEADWLLYNDGMSIRVDVDVEQIIAQYAQTGGYKYSREGMNDPTETALDDYEDFYIRFHQNDYFDRVAFGKEILDYFELPTRPVPEDLVRPVL